MIICIFGNKLDLHLTQSEAELFYKEVKQIWLDGAFSTI